MKQKEAAYINKSSSFFARAFQWGWARRRCFLFSCRPCSTGLIANFLGDTLFAAFKGLVGFFVVGFGTPSFVCARDVRPHTFEQALASLDQSEHLEAAEAARNGGPLVSADSIKRAKAREESPLVRQRLNQALVRSDSPEAPALLMTDLASDLSPMVRKGSAEQLSRYAENPDVAAALASALRKETVPEVRLACALSLALSHSFTAVNALDRAAHDPDPNLRRQAAFSLRHHTSREAVRALRRLQNDPDPLVRATAAGR